MSEPVKSPIKIPWPENSHILNELELMHKKPDSTERNSLDKKEQCLQFIRRRINEQIQGIGNQYSDEEILAMLYSKGYDPIKAKLHMSFVYQVYFNKTISEYQERQNALLPKVKSSGGIVK